MTPALRLGGGEHGGGWDTLLAAAAVSIAMFLIAGCAYPTRANSPNDQSTDATGVARAQTSYQGRLFLRVENVDPALAVNREGGADGSKSFTAAFELHGDAAQGDLQFFSPLGTQLANLVWTPSGANMTFQGETRSYARLEDMLLQATRADIPVAALLAWLRGQAFNQPGWQVDLAQFETGKIQAQRVTPLPHLELRIALDK